MHAITVPFYRRPKSQQNSRLSSLIKKYCNFENVNFDEVADGNVRVTDGAAYVPSYLAANMACPGDVDILYSTHSRLSVDVTLTGNRDGMFEPQNRAANIHSVICAFTGVTFRRIPRTRLVVKSSQSESKSKSLAFESKSRTRVLQLCRGRQEFRGKKAWNWKYSAASGVTSSER